MIKTLIIYSSKYGSTKEAAKIMSHMLSPSICCAVDEFKPEYMEYDFFIIGSPIYQEKIDSSLIKFIDNNRKWLQKKPISLFCTCIDKNGGLDRLTELQKFIGTKTLSMKALGGSLIINKLNNNDLQLIKDFLNTVKLPLEDMDFYSDEEIIKYSLKLKNIKDDLDNSE